MLAISTPEEFFEGVVIPNYREFRKASYDIRLAMNAAIAAFHMRDWMLQAYKGTDRVGDASGSRTYQAYLEKRCPEFEVLRDVANAAKHFLLEVRDDRQPKVWSAPDISIDGFRCGDPVGLPLTLLRVTTTDGSSPAFEVVIENVIAMWCRELGELSRYRDVFQ